MQLKFNLIINKLYNVICMDNIIVDLKTLIIDKQAIYIIPSLSSI